MVSIATHARGDAMDTFIDRQAELDTLEREYARTGSSFVVIYGRRRVGKTTLINQFIQDKRALYYLATQEPELQNLQSFQGVLADFLDNDLLRNARIERWEDLFRELARACTADRERTVVVIDEFQYLGKANPAYPSIFQRVWDTILKDANVMLILCGSLISLMRDQVLAEDTPLYGRRTAQIRLQQIPFAHYHEFFPGYSMRELVERYAVTGGVPKYIELFEDQPDIYQAITENVLKKDSFLYGEPTFLLQNEVKDIGSYYALMRVIAGGAERPSEIASRFGMKQTSISKYLKTLIDLDILARETPVTERNPEKSKRSLYKICDNFIAFWFTFVLPNLSYLETGRVEAVERRIRQNFVDAHVARVYENVCQERLWDLADETPLPFIPERVGRWWSGSHEIDACAVSSTDRRAIWGECKFWKNPVGENVLCELEEKVTSAPEAAHLDSTLVIFSVSGFTDRLRDAARDREDVILIDDSWTG